jgi:hypothetical protein
MPKALPTVLYPPPLGQRRVPDTERSSSRRRAAKFCATQLARFCQLRCKAGVNAHRIHPGFGEANSSSKKCRAGGKILGMRKLLKCWYVWLGLVLLLGLAGSVALILANPSRITQANFDRIQDGMSIGDVEAILWKADGLWTVGDRGTGISSHLWYSGPNWVRVDFIDGSADDKELHLATAWESLEWYAKKGAKKVGIIKRVPNPFGEVVD